MARRVSFVSGACFAYAEGGGLCTPGEGQGERILDPEWTFERLVATGEAVCGLRDGRVGCWLTPHDHTRPFPRHDLTGRPPDLELDEVTDLVASPWFFCALVHGDVWCWDAGTTHLGWAEGCGENEPTQMSALGDVTAIALSSGAILCVLRRAGEVLCWGGNADGYTMGGPTSEMWVSRTPRAVAVGTPLEWVRSVAPLAFCGAAADDSMWCWGFGPSALLDLEADEWLGPASLFEAVPVDLRATDVAGNATLGCVVRDGEVHCVARSVALPSDCPGGLRTPAVIVGGAADAL